MRLIMSTRDQAISEHVSFLDCFHRLETEGIVEQCRLEAQKSWRTTLAPFNLTAILNSHPLLRRNSPFRTCFAWVDFMSCGNRAACEKCNREEALALEEFSKSEVKWMMKKYCHNLPTKVKLDQLWCQPKKSKTALIGAIIVAFVVSIIATFIAFK